MEASDSQCQLCTAKNWPSHMPKPSCRIRHDMQETDNPVTRWVYREILANREENEYDNPCPMIRLKERGLTGK